MFYESELNIAMLRSLLITFYRVGMRTLKNERSVSIFLVGSAKISGIIIDISRVIHIVEKTMRKIL